MKKWLKWLKIASATAVLTGFVGCSDEPKDNGGGEEYISFAKNIDLPADYKSTEEKLIKMSKIVFSEGKIYAALQYLDAYWNPNANSKILEIDAASGNILRTFTSNFQNVMDIEIIDGALFVADVGNAYLVGDGGITKIDLTNQTAVTILNGANVGAEPKKMQFISNNEGYIIMSKSYSDENWTYYEDERIAKFSINGNEMMLDYSELGIKNPVSDISYNSTTNMLWFGSGNNVSKYSVINREIEFEEITNAPIVSIKSVGTTTITGETSNWSAGVFGVISNDKYSVQSEHTGGDVVIGFANNKFFILERPMDGAQKMKSLTADGDFIEEDNFSTPQFNSYSVCGNGTNKIFVNSYGDGIISVFETK